MRLLAFVLILTVRAIGWVLLLPLRMLFPALFRPRIPNMIAVREDDPGMKAAIARARKTLPDFLARLRAGTADALTTSIKAGLPTKDGSKEHVWITNVRYEGGAFFGTLDNEPSADIGFVIGATVRVHESDISDWKLIENGKLVGGYTIRYIRSRMTKRQREYFDAHLPFTIDPPNAAQSAA